jgi:large subunit ribosomal protein L15
MNITEVTRKAGAKPNRKRVGRGEGSGLGKTSGRGHKGYGARAGSRFFKLYEGGMFPFFRRIPKLGFSNVQFEKVYQVVNVRALAEGFENGGHVTPAALEEKGLIRSAKAPVKVLGDGEIAAKLTVEAHRFSKSAEAKITAVGGSVKWLAPRPKKKFVKRPKPKAEAAPEGEGKAKKAGAASEGEGKSKKKKGGEAAAEAPAAE